MKKIFLALSLCTILTTGCVPLLIGAAGVVTGYVAFKDTVAGNIDGTFDDIWYSVKTVLENRTEIISEDTTLGIIKAKYANNNIVVKIIAFTDNAYKLKVTCRKSYIVEANLDLAQDLFTRIIKEIAHAQAAAVK